MSRKPEKPAKPDTPDTSDSPAPSELPQRHHPIPDPKPKGFVCRHCGARVCGRVPKEWKRAGERIGFVLYTRYRANAIYRVRKCLACGKRLRTVERVEAYSS